MPTLADVQYVDRVQLEDRWTDVFRRDTIVHLGIMGSIVAGTFQGYLKDRIAGPLPYALAELFFIAAFVVWFGGLAIRKTPIRGPGIVPMAVLIAVIVPILYLIHPGAPLTVELAGLRAWAEFPIACLMALTVIRSRGQVRAYVGLILILCVITAIYGIYQYWTGPNVLVSAGGLALERHGSSVFYRTGGETDFRAFSTFTFPAPFANMMVFGILLGMGAVLSDAWSRRTRMLIGLLLPLFFLGITVSGTRAALVILLLGLGVIGWYRGLGARVLLVLPLLLIAVYAGALLTQGKSFVRWQSLLLQEGLLWTYVWAPITIAARTLAEFPFGMGLGRSGVGVPYMIFRSYPSGYFRGSDGDIGRAAVEMGIFGVILLLIIVVALLPHAASAAKRLRSTQAQDLGLGIGAVVIATGALVIIGSPLSSVPHATIWWFLLGALLKVRMMADESK